MNREQQTCRQCGHSSGAHATVAGKERCANGCECSGFMLGDSTPPATPVESPDENWFQRQARLAARDVQLLPPWLRSHPPAVSGEGERLNRATWDRLLSTLKVAKLLNSNLEDRADVQDEIKKAIDIAEDLLRASTPTPGAPR